MYNGWVNYCIASYYTYTKHKTIVNVKKIWYQSDHVAWTIICAFINKYLTQLEPFEYSESNPFCVNSFLYGFCWTCCNPISKRAWSSVQGHGWKSSAIRGSDGNCASEFNQFWQNLFALSCCTARGNMSVQIPLGNLYGFFFRNWMFKQTHYS